MFKISEDLAKAILNYLATKPYLEVWQLIQELQKVEKIEDLKPSNSSGLENENEKTK